MKAEIQEAKEFANKYHHPLQKYGGVAYSYHLEQTADIIESICNEYGVQSDIKKRLTMAGWLHDILEDSFVNYSDISKEFGLFVAELVYSCQTEKGRTRKERFSDKFYSELRKIPYAFFVKACDRLANMRYSKASGSSMYAKYKAELAGFLEKGKPVDWINEEEQIISEAVIKLLLEV